MRHRLAGLALVLGTALALCPAPPAQAQWTTTATGPARQTVLSIPDGIRPALTSFTGLPPLGRVVTLSWPTAPMSDGRMPTGYVITRTGGMAVMSGGNCRGTSGVVPAQPTATMSCDDVLGVTLGTYTYTVTPVYGTWRGAASPASSVTL